MIEDQAVEEKIILHSRRNYTVSIPLSNDREAVIMPFASIEVSDIEPFESAIKRGDLWVQ